MRRGTWILAISGMMALHQSGFAADPVAGQPSGRISLGNSRSGRVAKKPQPSADSNAKNYYKDLFGEEEAAPTAPPKHQVSASAPTKAAPAKAAADDWTDEDITLTSGQEQSRNSAPKFDEPFDEPQASVAAPAAKTPHVAAAKAKPNAKVVQAVYDKPMGKKTPVQQVRNELRPRSAPVSGFDEVIEPPSAAPEKQRRIAVTREEPVVEAPTAAVPHTSQVSVEWAKRGEFNVGQECLVDLVVKNTGSSAVSDLAIDAFFPTHVRLTAAEPRPSSATDRLTWNIEQLPAAAEQKITIKLIPSRRGDVSASAQIRFTGSSAATFAIHEPQLKISIRNPAKEIMLGDPASQMITVTNPGTGTAQDVKIEAQLSDGLEHPTRDNRLVIDVGAIGAGETRTYRLGLTASKGGMQSVQVVATSSGDATSSDAVEFQVIAPSLKLAVDGPSLRYKGRNAKYQLTITNDGSVANNNVQVTQQIGEGFKFLGADHQGKFDASQNCVNWYVGRLEPGESAHVTCELNAQQLGEFTNSFQVISDAGVRAEAKALTRVDGIASLTMELVDFDDPVETGAETAYEIRVKNDGSKAATGVSVACELPGGMEFLSAKSPMERVVEGRLLSFNSNDEIAPGEQVTIRIQMKVVREGSHRLRARLTGGGLQEPLVLEEVTRAYSDGSN